MADYVSALTGPEMDEALYDMASHTSEAWAVGTRNDEPVTSGDPTYNNNSRYWAGRSANYNTNAQAAAARAEAAVPAGTAGAVFFDRAQSLTDAQKAQAQENVGATGHSNPNLFINPWFPSAMCINQRGFSSATSIGWTVDMWHKATNNGTVTWSSGGLTLTTTDGTNYADIRQYLPDTVFKLKTGRTYTLSYMTSGRYIQSVSFTMPNTWPTENTVILSNTVLDYLMMAASIRPANNTLLFQFRAKAATSDHPSVTLRALKLEEGSVSTLAYDNPVNREEEWRKCRYFYRRLLRNSSFARIGVAQNSTTADFPNITDGQAMFKTPTVTMTGTTNVWNGVNSAVTALSVSASTIGDMTLVATTTGLTAGQALLLNPASGAYIEFDAQPTIG